MKVWKDISGFRAVRPVVTIGIFDGVHSGHRYLINKLKEKARILGGESVVITLWPHPRIVLNKDPDNLRYLSTIEEKTELMEAAGIDHLVIIPFTRHFATLRSCEFVEKYLVKGIGIRHLIIGFNHKFGKDREGDYSSLKKCADQFGFGIEKLDPVQVKGVTISSSLVRELLEKGAVERANACLGYDYFINGEVVGGNRIGSKIGFPTANIRPSDPHKLLPAVGVYAVFLDHRGKRYPGMLNIGFRPTFDEHAREKSVEVNIFGLNADLYDENVTIYFYRWMRKEKKFENIEQLKAQLVKDRKKAVELLSRLK